MTPARTRVHRAARVLPQARTLPGISAKPRSVVAGRGSHGDPRPHRDLDSLAEYRQGAGGVEAVALRVEPDTGRLQVPLGLGVRPSRGEQRLRVRSYMAGLDDAAGLLPERGAELTSSRGARCAAELIRKEGPNHPLVNWAPWFLGSLLWMSRWRRGSSAARGAALVIPGGRTSHCPPDAGHSARARDPWFAAAAPVGNIPDRVLADLDHRAGHSRLTDPSAERGRLRRPAHRRGNSADRVGGFQVRAAMITWKGARVAYVRMLRIASGANLLDILKAAGLIVGPVSWHYPTSVIRLIGSFAHDSMGPALPMRLCLGCPARAASRQGSGA